jgi:anti-sigma B factor antagonist
MAGEARANGGTIALSGDIDRTAEGVVTAAYDEVLRGGTSDLSLDFTEVTYINSTGIAVIVSILARAKRDGMNVSAYGLTDHYKHVFEITRLSDFMTIHENGAAAKEGMQ